ncbi:MAG: RHS repeat-associated core domain-containing protein, partial [Bacillota bacterium]|nr:RHS repeat-associated core domain-containing protein [Bacillota bacterium]
ISAPMMTDASGAVSEAVNLSIVSNKGSKLSVKITADSKWLSDSKRAYPVSVDPDVTVTSDGSITSSFVLSGAPSNNYASSSRITVEGSVGTGPAYGLIKVTSLPSLSAGDVLTSAKLNLTTSISTNTTVNAHNITSSWDSTVTWNTKPSFDSTVLDYVVNARADMNVVKSWDITTLAKKWYSGFFANYGILLDTQSQDVMTYCSINNSTTSYRPTFLFSYRNFVGTESYMTKHTYPAGVNGTGSINDYTGNLTVTQNLFSQTGSKNPVSASLTYNQVLYNTAGIGFCPSGYGWQFNFDERIDLPSASLQALGYQYVFTSGDGQRTYYKYNSTNSDYEDEDSSGSVIKVHSTYLEMDTTFGDILSFAIPNSDGTGGYIQSDTDSNGNTTTYNATTYTPTGQTVLGSITDATGSTAATFTYGTNNGKAVVTQITDFDNRNYYFTYDASYTVNNQTGEMTSITYPDNQKASFVYQNYGNLTNVYKGSVSSYSGGVSYNYDTQTGQVTCANEIDGSNNIANFMTMSYGFNNATTFTDRNSRTETFQFDNTGRTVQVLADDGSIGSVNNSTTGAVSYSASEKYTKNYISDSSVESGGSTYSTATWDSSAAGTFAVDTTTAFLGSKSLKITNTGSTQFSNWYDKTVSTGAVNGKDFTLSAYVKTSSVSASATNGGAVVRMDFLNSNNSVISSATSPVGTTGTNDWQRIFVIGTAPTNTTQIRVDFGVYNAQGTAWFDCMQLEQASCMNSYNALENGDFSGSNAWGNGASTTLLGGSTTQATDPQTIQVNKSNVNFNIYGTASANSVPLASDSSRAFGINVLVTYSDATTENHFQSFNPDTSTTQEIAFSVEPYQHDKVIQQITYSYEYFKNANTMTLGNAMVNISTQVNAVSATSTDAPTTTGTQAPTQLDTTPYFGSVTSTSPTGVSNDTGMINPITQTVDTSQPYMHTVTTYDSTGQYITSQTDESGKTTSYGVNSNNGLATTITDQNGNVKNYTYNPYNYKTTAVSNSTGTVQNTYSYNSYGQLTTINHNSFNYSFTYDVWGNIITTNVGTQTLATNTYASYDGDLTQTAYGNNQTIHYQYDRYDRVTVVLDTNNVQLATYVYNNKNQVARMIDNANGITTDYVYDGEGTLLRKIYSGAKTGIEYYQPTTLGTNTTTSINGQTFSSQTSTDPTTANPVQTDDSFKTTTTSDNFGRVTDVHTVTAYGPSIISPDKSYTYVAGNGTNQTSNLISGINYTSNGTNLIGYTYTYDNNGNILTVSENGTLRSSYTYDGLNELQSEKDYVQLTEKYYTYNTGGNITQVDTYPINSSGNRTSSTPTSTLSNSYGDTNWKDKLTTYNGQTLSYDNIGNPTTYRDGMTMTWKNGRQLATLQQGSNSISYEYDPNGLRTSKTVNSSTTLYYYDDNGNLTSLVTPSGHVMHFFYGDDGTVSSLRYDNSSFNDYLIKNQQGDVTKILDSFGTIVANYTYDAWGKLLSVKDASGNTITDTTSVALINPIRYRGYVYDNESGLYYLQSRYYDPTTCRFVNADSQINSGVLGANTFAYCENNPVCNYDPQGTSFYIVHHGLRTTKVDKRGFWQLVVSGLKSIGWNWSANFMAHSLENHPSDLYLNDENSSDLVNEIKNSSEFKTEITFLECHYYCAEYITDSRWHIWMDTMTFSGGDLFGALHNCIIQAEKVYIQGIAYFQIIIYDYYDFATDWNFYKGSWMKTLAILGNNMAVADQTEGYIQNYSINISFYIPFALSKTQYL